MNAPAALFAHLAEMTDEHGLFEHAEYDKPRPQHGYCTDDNARLLVVTSREVDDDVTGRLSRVALGFLREAMADDGQVRNRMDSQGVFTDNPSTADWWGRALWGLGAAAAHHDDPTVRTVAATLFTTGAQQRSSWPRSMAFAALGAAELAALDPSDDVARAMLVDAVATIGRPRQGPWRWPEDRLTYANAALAEALIGAGATLGDEHVLEDGLTMLDWLLDRWTHGDHLSVTGTGGDGRRDDDPSAAHDVRPAFDQQSIEVSSLADACWRAHAVTANRHWAEGVALADRWFDGHNDGGVVMHDSTTGGGFDGLERNGVTLNQGAESTLARVSTRQRARSLDRLTR